MIQMVRIYGSAHASHFWNSDSSDAKQMQALDV